MFMSEAYEDMRKKVENQNEEIGSLKKTVANLKLEEQERKTEEMKKIVEEMGQYSRNRNIEISNIPEDEKEDEEKLLEKIGKIAELGGISYQPGDIDVTHRLPSKKPGKPRSVVVQFRSRTSRNQWMQKKTTHGVTVGDLQGNEDPTMACT